MSREAQLERMSATVVFRVLVIVVLVIQGFTLNDLLMAVRALICEMETARWERGKRAAAIVDEREAVSEVQE
jgi:uncharacterized membrane protein